jgi:DNA-binding response OmpR family regulator
VEDEPAIRRINASVLQDAGYHVDTAEDGAFAWKLLGSRSYDLMITDNNMPRLTGVELLKKLFAARMTLPFIMASGTIPETEFIRHPWLQPAAILVKPYTVVELLGAVENVLRQAPGAATGTPALAGRDSMAGKIAQTVEPAGAPVPCRTSPPRRVLVVEDEPDLRRLNAEALESFGYEVHTAEDGLAGWKALHATRHAPESYALLIANHDLPGISGLALVKKLRAARMALPVIMVTGITPAEDLANRYPWLQPAATLVKPYSIEQLLGTVETVLRVAGGVRAESAPPPADGLQL